MNRNCVTTGTNFISEKFKDFCSWLGIHNTESSLYNLQSNRKAGVVYIKFIK